MQYDRKKHHRRSIRPPDHDYRFPGAYFVTICRYQGEPLFGEFVDEEVVLNEYGQIAREEWQASEQVRREIELDAFIIMPIHIHGIAWIRETDDDSVVEVHNVGARPCAPTGTPKQCPTRIIGGHCPFVQISRDEAYQPHAWHARCSGLAAQLVRTHCPQRRSVGTNPRMHTEQPSPLARGSAASCRAAQPVQSRQSYGRGAQRPMRSWDKEKKQ